MTTTSKYSELITPTDFRIKKFLQHQTNMLLKGLIISTIKTIELAVLCDDRCLKQTAMDSYKNYTNAQQLIKYFIVAGINPVPDENTIEAEEMKKNFNVSYEDILHRLSDDTIDKIISNGRDIL